MKANDLRLIMVGFVLVGALYNFGHGNILWGVLDIIVIGGLLLNVYLKN